jgi:cytidine deaminase
MTICAERNAVFQAVAEGITEFLAIAIYVDSDLPFPPCGACRQVLAEFADDLLVIIANKSASVVTELSKLLPERFTLVND